MRTPLRNLTTQDLPKPSMSRPWLWCLDIDGTLLDLARDPASVLVPQDLLEDLTILARSPHHRLSFVSGRAVDQVHDLFPIDGTLAWVGNHGAEMWTPGARWVDPRAEEARASVENLATACEALREQFPALWLEHKGVSLSLHYRQMNPRLEPLLKQAMEDLISPYTPQWMLHPAHKCWEIRLAVAPNKGDAVLNLIELTGHTPLVLVFGDDVTDEDAFRAVASSGFGVLVGPSHESCARFQVPSPRDLRAWIHDIAGLTSEDD